MALEAGSITVDEDGSATGDGLAFAMYEGTTADLSDAARASVAESLGPYYEQLAAAIVNHFKDNGLIVVSVSAGGLQRMSDPVAADAPTQAPAAPVTLNGTIE